MASSQEIKDGYTSTLQDLTFNSKPLINALTMLADENVANAKDIVEAIETHLSKVRTEIKLPVLYLIDCIIKNVGEPYTSAFCNNIVHIFCSVFEVVDEKTRTEMYKLRQTWNEVIAKSKLYALDVKTNQLDPAWPITAQPPTIHFNPKFLNSTNTPLGVDNSKTKINQPSAIADPTLDMKQKLILKQKQLLELQQKKLELELLQTQVQLQEQQRKSLGVNLLEPSTNLDEKTVTTSKQMLLKPQAAKEILENDIPMVNVINKTIPLQLNTNQRFPLNNNTMLPNIAPITNHHGNNNNHGAIVGGVRPIRDPRLLRQQATTQINSVSAILAQPPPLDISSDLLALDNTTIVNNKLTGRESRFVDNKDEEPKIKTLSRIPLKSKRFTSPKNNAANATTAARGSKSSSTTGSSSSLDSPVKKATGRSASKSPSKSSSSRHKKSSRSEKRSGKRKSRSRSPSKGGFKDPKGAKGRNYVRRNRPISISPEKDIKKDVDLRVVPTDKPIKGKKRISSETAEIGSNKKNKSEVFDALFGNEDVDLRVLSADSERPITPPAPIISNKKNETTEKENSSNGTENKDQPIKINLDALRAKLAEATNKNKMNKSRQQQEKEVKVIGEKPTHQAQEVNVLGKIIQQIDNQRAKDAANKDQEESASFTQPISDDDFDSDIELKKEEPAVSKPRFNRDHPQPPTWKQKQRGGGGGHFVGPRTVARARPEPWIRPPIQQGATSAAPVVTSIWNPPFNPPPVLFDDEKSNDALSMDIDSPPSILIPDDISLNSFNSIKSINIDGEPKDIIFYGETAIAFMSPDDPRELSFQAGQRRVCFGDSCSFVLYFNDPYRDVLINGHCHRIRLGAPTREIYIDGKPYECVFGGPAMHIELDRKIVLMQLEGPLPQVKIGTLRRTDLVVGKVNLIVDAKTIVPIYLDGRTQTFEVNGHCNTIRFKDALKTVLINDRPYNLEFGGLPKAVSVNGRKHFVRFSVLPRGVRPGHVYIKDMEGYKPPQEIVDCDNNSQEGYDLGESSSGNGVSTVASTARRKTRFSNPSPDRTVLPPPPQPLVNQFDAFASTIPPRNPSSTLGFHDNPIVAPPPLITNDNTPIVPPSSIIGPVSAPPPVAVTANIPPILNIEDLFQKLVATGIVATVQNPVPPPVVPETVPPPVPPTLNPVPDVPVVKNFGHVHNKTADFNKPSSLKIRQSGLIQGFYAGMQCSSCGMRFPADNSGLYSQHLDWHFRQNRRGKKNSRKASSRRWYYSISDWNNYEEIEDLEEREKCYFENQQKDQNEGNNEDGDLDIEIPSVPADSKVPDASCEVCQEKFEQFYSEEKEEWHLRMAIRIEDKTYHPLCYEDYQASLLNDTMDESMDQSKIEATKEEITTIPGLDVDDDNMDNEEIVIENSDNEQEVASPKKDDEVVKSEEPEEKPATNDEDVKSNHEEDVPMDEDDDVVIQEEKIEKIVLDEYEFKHPLGENGLIPGVVVKQEPIDEVFTAIENNLDPAKKSAAESEAAQDESFEDIGHVVDQQSETTTETATMETSTSEDTVTAPIDDGANLESNINAGANVQLVPPTTTVSGGLSGKIKINISKPLLVIAPKENKDISSDNDNTVDPVDPIQPLPPGEEPVQLNLKPALQGIELKQLPPVNKGSELTGLCSIM